VTVRAPTPVISGEHETPLLRGWIHLVCFFFALPTAAWVVIAAAPSARAGAAVYAAGLVALFGVSGSYHRGRWSTRWRDRMRRLDHATIFVMIAGSYTPLCVLVLRGWLSAVLLTVVWGGAVTGAVLAWWPGIAAKAARNALYLVLGWVSVLAMPDLVRQLSAVEVALMAAGGLLFTLGALVLFVRWPNPSPSVFGYHEVWHALVVAAVVCHLLAISAVVRTGA
jgi:hemolysin III